jgi:hypothetical protein
MDYSINSTETKTINLNNAELNELDYIISTRINLIMNNKYKDKFKYSDDKKQLDIIYNIQTKLNDSI